MDPRAGFLAGPLEETHKANGHGDEFVRLVERAPVNQSHGYCSQEPDTGCRTCDSQRPKRIGALDHILVPQIYVEQDMARRCVMTTARKYGSRPTLAAQDPNTTLSHTVGEEEHGQREKKGKGKLMMLRETNIEGNEKEEDLLRVIPLVARFWNVPQMLCGQRWSSKLVNHNHWMGPEDYARICDGGFPHQTTMSRP